MGVKRWQEHPQKMLIRKLHKSQHLHPISGLVVWREGRIAKITSVQEKVRARVLIQVTLMEVISVLGLVIQELVGDTILTVVEGRWFQMHPLGVNKHLLLLHFIKDQQVIGRQALAKILHHSLEGMLTRRMNNECAILNRSSILKSLSITKPILVVES